MFEVEGIDYIERGGETLTLNKTHTLRGNAVNTFSDRACSISLAFLLCSGAVGGGVEVGMPLCGVPVFGDKHCCGRNV